MDVLFYGVPIVIIAIAIVLFWMAGLPKIKSMKLSFVMCCLGVNVIVTPLSLFIGVMATDSPTSTIMHFWAGFLFIQGIPLLVLMIGTFIWLIGRRENK